MRPFYTGFRNELTKVALVGGVLKRIGRFAFKHPMIALGAGATVVGAGTSAASAYKQGLRGGEKGRYLAAGVDPTTGEASTSPAAYTNYNALFPRKATPRQIKALHKDYDEKKFKR